jgi:GntR family transcriptional regulator, transcriptional repressor for pyruvate dehydrogenase complex
MPIETIEPRRLYRKIADQLRKLIDVGEFAVGARLPPERDLATQFGVSRPSVREALIALEVEGLVEVRMGSGIYVRSRDAATPGRTVSAEGPFEVIGARLLIEGELAANAARRMNAGQIAGLRHAVEVMRDESRRGVIPIRADRMFHQRVAEASDNAVLVRVVTELFEERNNPLFARLGTHFEDAWSWELAIGEHNAVVDAITRHAPDEARAAMQRHLQASGDRFAAGFAPGAESAADRFPATTDH